MKITANPKYTIGFELPLETLKALQKLSGHHYDGLCKAAGKTGGFIYGWVGAVEWAIEYNKEIAARVEMAKELGQIQLPGELPHELRIRAEFRDLDISLKIMELMEEMHRFKVLNDEEYSALFKLRSFFTRCCHKLNDLYVTVEWEEEL